jgi:hypothetical protein
MIRGLSCSPAVVSERVHQVFGEMTVGYKLFFESIFVVDFARGLASTIPYFRCSS